MAMKKMHLAFETRMMWKEYTGLPMNIVFSPASWERFKSMWEKGWNARRKKPPRSESCGGFKFP